MKKCLGLMGLTMVALLLFSVYGYCEEKNDIGLGVVLGEPSGINGQFFWSQRSAVDITAAWSWRDWFFASADYQIYDYILDSPREWKWFYGVGLFAATPENEHGRFGIRIPVGVRYRFPHSDIDAWAEAAPALRLFDETVPELQGGIGITFWIK